MAPDERVEAAIVQIAGFLDDKRDWMARRDWKEGDRVQRDRMVTGQHFGVFYYRSLLQIEAMRFNWDDDDGPAAALVTDAWNGDVDADHVLRTVAISYIRDGASPPGLLGGYVMSVLARGSFPTPKQGRPAMANFARDLLLTSAIAMAMDLGFKPTRDQKGRKGVSACILVQRSLARAKLTIVTDQDLQKIWNRLGSGVPRRVGSERP